MIAARIGQSRKRIYTVPAGVYEGFWQDYFCWIYVHGTEKIFARFETSTKCEFKRGEKVTVDATKIKFYIYEHQRNTKNPVR